MTLRYRSAAGTWIAPAAGDLFYRASSATFQPIGRVRVKDETGVWLDSGYLGPPGVPLNLGVSTWSYSRLTVDWDPPSTAVQPTRYIVRLTGPAGGVISESEVSASTRTASWGVAQETRYQVFVRSKGSNGALSAWTPALQVGIGRPRITRIVEVARERDWVATRDVNMYRAEEWGNVIPQNVRVTEMRVDLTASWDTPKLCYEGTDQRIHFIRRGEEGADVGTRNNPWTLRFDFAQNAAGLHGLICRGAEWSTRGEDRRHHVTGWIRSFGIETYMVEQTQVIQTEIKNYLW
jgi:hypothetical protein